MKVSVTEKNLFIPRAYINVVPVTRGRSPVCRVLATPERNIVFSFPSVDDTLLLDSTYIHTFFRVSKAGVGLTGHHTQRLLELCSLAGVPVETGRSYPAEMFPVSESEVWVVVGVAAPPVVLDTGSVDVLYYRKSSQPNLPHILVKDDGSVVLNGAMCEGLGCPKRVAIWEECDKIYVAAVDEGGYKCDSYKVVHRFTTSERLYTYTYVREARIDSGTAIALPAREDASLDRTYIIDKPFFMKGGVE